MTMERNLKKLTAEPLDIVVIGGGAHGATVTYHAARAGFRVALVEKNDFCSATSANSLKILHGGLRYLQHLNIKRMRHSILARREMMHLAPHLVQPLPCLMPVYGHGLRGKTVMRTALFLNDCIGWDRNQGLPADIQLPASALVSRKKCEELIPTVNKPGLQGGAVWHDVLALDTERLIISYILEAADLGAGVANYTEATGLLSDGDGLYRLILKDALSSQIHTIQTRFVINAAGPWMDNLSSGTRSPGTPAQKWAMALNIVSRKKIFEKYAVALEGNRAYADRDAIIKRGKRLYFFVPWQRHTMIGTEYQVSTAPPDKLNISREHIENMINEVNAIYPSAQLQYDDISFYHAGLLPMAEAPDVDDGHVQLEKTSSIQEHDTSGFKGVFSIKGVKYTTAPHIASQLMHILSRRCAPTNRIAVPETLASCPHNPSVNEEVMDVLQKRYGRRSNRAAGYINTPQDNTAWLDRRAEFLRAEVAYLITEEMACTLSDIVFRRTGLGTAECPPKATLTAIAEEMARLLRWDEERTNKEIGAVLNRYTPLTPV